MPVFVANIVEIPSPDDKGDWYVIINGEAQTPSFWSENDAYRALDDYLWRVRKELLV